MGSSLILGGAGAGYAQSVVINEIHYDSFTNARPSEFIELHNPGTVGLDLAGWRLEDAVDYVFPAGTNLAAGGFVVVTRDPVAFLADFKTTALGPWAGVLSNSGERIQLRNAGGVLVDEVEYAAGFPWPTHAAGGGSSMELINPQLDNNLGGSWRSSPGPGAATNNVPLIAPAATGWRFRRGTSEASDPVTAWREADFVEDTTWATVQTPLGYSDPNLKTDLLAPPWVDLPMAQNHISVFLRKSFTVQGTMPNQLRVRLSVDDGGIVWINGVLVGRANISGTDEKPYNAGVLEPAGIPAGATNHEAVTTAGVPVWQDLVISPALVNLRPGANTIAVQAFNDTIGSSDFSVDAQLIGEYTPLPTPGIVNVSYSLNAPPQVRQVEHTPRQPTAGVPVVISAKVTDQPDGLASMTLSYQIVEPGAYIRKKDPAYQLNWIPVPMLDDGTGGDVASRDSVYTVTLPASVQVNRRLIRYRITAVDGRGNSVQVPYVDDGSPNFAYFCYNGVPAWSGAFRPAAAGEVGIVKQFPEPLMRERAAYHLIANQTDVTNSQYTNGQDTLRMESTFVFEDQVMDHVTFHNRGEFSTYVSGKNKWRVHFNRTRELRPRDDYDQPYQQSWGDLNLNGGSCPWIASNRGMAGVEERLSFRLYELAGVPSPKTHYVSLRVIDNAVEAADPAAANITDPSLGSGRTYAGQYSGDFWGQYIAMESPDGSFLDERRLADGNVYKIEGGGTGTGDKKHQAVGQAATVADWTDFSTKSGGTQTEAWWRANMDLRAYYNFRAVCRIVGNVDLRAGWNHYFYHAPAGGWKPIPWDLDMMFVGRTHQSASGAITQDRCLTLPVFENEKRNHCRELLDLLVDDNTPNGGQIGQLVDDFAQRVNPTGQALTWADIDAAMWNFHPRSAGSASTPPSVATDSNHKGNFYYGRFTFNAAGGAYTRWLRTPTFTGTGEHEDFMKYLTDYMTATYPGPAAWAINNGNQLGYGYEYLKREAADTAIPNRPVITYVGDATYPANGLRFESGAFTDPQGAETFAAMQWRLGELAAPGLPGYVPGTPRRYEVEESWTSPEITTFTAGITLPTSAIRPGQSYRARVRHKDATGKWSRWSLPAQFAAAVPDVSVYTASLVISEIMYHPASPTAEESALGFTADDFEYIELLNTSTASIDLTDVRFTKGIDYNFPAGTQIAPGAYLLIVKNPAAFEKRYGTGKPIAGNFGTDQLKNSGEEVKLSYGAGTPIRSVTYQDALPWPAAADGDGPSLQLVSPQTRPDHALPPSWRASLSPAGSPGGPDAAGLTFAAWANGLGLPADPAFDTDVDGASNKLEFALGTDPKAAQSVPLLSVGLENLFLGGQTTVVGTISFLHRTDSGELVHIVEFSNDLSIWAAGGTLIRSEAVSSGIVRETWQSPESIAARSRCFGRVRIP